MNEEIVRWFQAAAYISAAFGIIFTAFTYKNKIKSKGVNG
jgi:hypothetical protein